MQKDAQSDNGVYEALLSNGSEGAGFSEGMHDHERASSKCVKMSYTGTIIK